METDGTTHRLAAIISGDIVGYSRLIGTDESVAVRLVTAYREEVELLVRQNHGHLVDFTGDNFLAHFSSSLSAVGCAVEIQQVLKARNQRLPDDQKMRFRIGIHQGDVRIEGDRVFGTGVNVAARLEAMADPGGICISGSVRDELQGRMDLRTEDMGSKSVKNIPEPVPVYRVIFGEDAASTPAPTQSKSSSRPRMTIVVAAAVLLLVVGVGFWLTQRSHGPEMVSATAAGTAAAAAATKSVEEIGNPFAGSPDQSERPSIVVLPFNNMSGDQEQEYFADGITEDLTTDLSKIPQLFVIARNSAFAYKGEGIDVEQIGRELGVRYALEGSVRKVQDRVRINAQLIDTSTGFHVWGERYDRELSDIFAVQNEISEKILMALRLNIEEAELARIRRQPIENLNAYEAWHRGRYVIRGLTRETVADGRKLLERAIELQPNYGEAYAALSDSYMAEFVGWNFDPALPVKALELAARGLELSPNSSLCVISMGSAELGRFRPDNALELADRAIKLAPSSSVAFSIRGVAQIQLGNFEEARDSLGEAVRLNPMMIDINYTMLGIAQFNTGDAETAVRLWERVRASNQEALFDRVFLAQHYQSVSDNDQAKAVVGEILKANPYYTADEAVEMIRFISGIPEGMESLIRGNLKLAGLP